MAEVVDGKLVALKLTRAQAARLRRITKALTGLGPCLQGSLVVRRGTCGKDNCACHGDPPRLHGPYRSWTRKVEGKTVTRVLSEEEFQTFGELFANEQRLRELMEELRALGLEIVEGNTRPVRSR